jgi:hypothetical protein
MVGSSPGQVKPKTNKIGINCFSIEHAALKSGWLRISVMYLNGGTCLPAECYCSDSKIIIPEKRIHKLKSSNNNIITHKTKLNVVEV